MLDRPERDASPVVEDPRRDERTRWADAQACIATAATLRQRLVDVQLGRCHDFGQQNVRSNAGDEQVGIFPEPPDAGPCRRRAVEHPAVVDVRPGRVTMLAQHLDQGRHPLVEHVVVVVAERVSGDPATWTAGIRVLFGRSLVGTRMRKRERDHAPRVRARTSRVSTCPRASFAPPGQAIHQPCAGACGCGFFGVAKRRGTRHPNRAEAEIFGPTLDRVGQRHRSSLRVTPE